MKDSVTTNPIERFKKQMHDSAGPKDWPEDYAHENGTYTCECCACGETFIGYKRRVVCKECHDDAAGEQI